MLTVHAVDGGTILGRKDDDGQQITGREGTDVVQGGARVPTEDVVLDDVELVQRRIAGEIGAVNLHDIRRGQRVVQQTAVGVAGLYPTGAFVSKGLEARHHTVNRGQGTSKLTAQIRPANIQAVLLQERSPSVRRQTVTDGTDLVNQHRRSPLEIGGRP